MPAVVGVSEVLLRLLIRHLTSSSNEFASFTRVLRSVCFRLFLDPPFLFVIGMLHHVIWRLDIVLPTCVRSFIHDLRQDDKRRMFCTRCEKNFVSNSDALSKDVVVRVEADAINWHCDGTNDVENSSQCLFSVFQEQHRVNVQWN